MDLSLNGKYENVVIFSGGGTRFAIYCGMYAALEECGFLPDLIIASCGGTISASIINSFPTNTQRQQYLQSEELFDYIRSTQLTNERKLYKLGLLSLKKLLNKRKAPFVEDVFNRYLVEMPNNLTSVLPSLSKFSMGTHTKSIYVGARVLFSKAKLGEKRADHKLYRKVLFTDRETASNIFLDKIGIASEHYYEGAIDSSTEIITDIPMLVAMRISLSDMFYVPPVHYQGNYFTGGAIDLLPIELAKSLGTNIFAEKKETYSCMEEALVRAVLGYSGNHRLDDVNAMGADIWLDTSNAKKDLNGYYCRKEIDWLRLQLSISLPKSKELFVRNMEKLWEYGYNCVMKTLSD